MKDFILFFITEAEIHLRKALIANIIYLEGDYIEIQQG